MAKRNASPRLFTRAEEAVMVAAVLHDLGGPEVARTQPAAEVPPTDPHGRQKAEVTTAPVRIGLDGDEAAPHPKRGRWPGKRPKRLHALS